MEAEGEEQVSQAVVLLYSPFAQKISSVRTRRRCRSSSTGHSTWPQCMVNPRDPTDLAQETLPSDLVERGLQVHGQKASSFVDAVGV